MSPARQRSPRNPRWIGAVALAGLAIGATLPGGSMRDEETIAAADDPGMAMVFTAPRHFRH